MPLISMSVAAREACLRVTEQRVEAWLEILTDLILCPASLKAA
jgi:hypothetical protein